MLNKDWHLANEGSPSHLDDDLDALGSGQDEHDARPNGAQVHRISRELPQLAVTVLLQNLDELALLIVFIVDLVAHQLEILQRLQEPLFGMLQRSELRSRAGNMFSTGLINPALWFKFTTSGCFSEKPRSFK